MYTGQVQNLTSRNERFVISVQRMRSFDDVLKLEKECGFNAFRFASPTFTPWEAAFWLYRYDDRVRTCGIWKCGQSLRSPSSKAKQLTCELAVLF